MMATLYLIVLIFFTESTVGMREKPKLLFEKGATACHSAKGLVNFF